MGMDRSPTYASSSAKPGERGAPRRVGVTRWEDVPGESIEPYWLRLQEAGADVVDLDASCAARVADLAPSLDALVLTGGIDIDPSRYDADRHAKVKRTSPERDAMELAFLADALRRDLPVLAICRGHQLLNVAFGGSLLQHIESGDHRADYRTEGFPSRWHQVRIDKGSRIACALGGTEFELNSRHHQAVRLEVLASGLDATAFADEQGTTLVEGIESTQHRWVVGVQWHPERLEPERPHFAPLMRKLYASFVSDLVTRT